MTQAMDHVEAHPVETGSRVPSQGFRLPAIDRMRGFVILLMALDHVRDFFSADALHFDPTDLAHLSGAVPDPLCYTHLCTYLHAPRGRVGVPARNETR